MPLLSPGYLGTIPTLPISQELEFVYLLPTRLKLSWNTLQKGLVGLRHSHGVLLFQVLAAPRGEAGDGCCSQPSSAFPLAQPQGTFPCSPCSKHRVCYREKQSDLLRFFQGGLCALEEKLIWAGFWTWNYSSTSCGCHQSWTPYQSLHGIDLKYFKFALTLLSASIKQCKETNLQ